MNKLKLRPEDEREDNGFLLEGAVAVVSVTDEDGDDMNMPVYGVRVETVDDDPYLGAATVNGVKYFPLESPESVNVDDENGKITFSSYGKMYTIRAFEDSDGSWASVLESPVPAESLEERYMAEVDTAFSPDAPAVDENLYAAVDEDTNEVKELVYSTTTGMYTRSSQGWFRVPKDDESLDDLAVYEVNPKFIKVFDMAEANDEVLFVDDLDTYEIEFRGALTAAVSADCPPATQDIGLNLKNRKNAIDTAMYGPLNPDEPNEDYWQKLADEWSVDPEVAKQQRCGNCAVFIVTPEMKECISLGLTGTNDSDEFDSIDSAGELGYCEAFDFKCASARTCRAWVAGGPVTEVEADDNND